MHCRSCVTNQVGDFRNANKDGAFRAFQMSSKEHDQSVTRQPNNNFASCLEQHQGFQSTGKKTLAAFVNDW